MKKLIRNDLSKCFGCKSCIRACPLSDANIAFIENGQFKVRIDSEKCMACGACLFVCPHKSRDYEDDTERFIEDLKNGVAISVFCEPEGRANLRDWDRILAWLRKMGAKHIFDMSLGAAISTWAYIRWVQRNNLKSVISRPCPSIVDYILRHNSSILPYLSPVHSAAMCAAVYMRRYQDITHKFAVISPCIAKTNEFTETEDLVLYNVTFKKLADYLARNDIKLPVLAGKYDHPQSGLGAGYSDPGLLNENVEFFLAKALHVCKSEGQSVVYKVLDEFGRESQGNRPVVFELLNCSKGCALGTGTVRGCGVFTAETAAKNAVNGVLTGRERKYFEHMLADFDCNLRFVDFTRQYYPRTVTPGERFRKHFHVLENLINYRLRSNAYSAIGNYRKTWRA